MNIIIPLLTLWFETSSRGEEYNMNFDEIEKGLQDIKSCLL
ncbi:hypothetical protein LCGC14_0973410 [marine sediment metagenome]|uniref:Uncharacterized protein n=1 Tax=marine sediment metagenome TaxID=412755 RepID=A0A0F9RHC9_9ZZZZ